MKNYKLNDATSILKEIHEFCSLHIAQFEQQLNGRIIELHFLGTETPLVGNGQSNSWEWKLHFFGMETTLLGEWKMHPCYL